MTSNEVDPNERYKKEKESINKQEEKSTYNEIP